MTVWFLILALAVPGRFGAPPILLPQPFATEIACNEAGDIAYKSTGSNLKVSGWICIPRR